MTIEDFIPDIATELTNRDGLPREVNEEGALPASGRAPFVTGAVIAVGGGWSAKLA